MQEFILNPVEFAKTSQQMDLKNAETFDKISRATNALRKGTEKNNVLRNNRISEIDDTINITISCLNQTILAITVMDILLFKN